MSKNSNDSRLENQKLVAAMITSDDPLEDGGPSQRRRSAQRRRIYREAGKLFEENGGEKGGGFEKTTVEQIAARSDISVRTFFRYFESKADVIYVNMPVTVAIHLAWTKKRLEHSDPLTACVEASTVQLTYTMADDLDHSRVYRAAVSPLCMARRGRFREHWKRELSQLVEGHLTAGTNVGPRALAISALALNVHDLSIRSWAAEKKKEILDCIADALDATRWAIMEALPASIEDNLNVGSKSEDLSASQRRRTAQKRRIVAEAVRLFEENGGEEGGGHDNTTVEQIAERSDISVRTFFRYFQSKTDVIYLDTRAMMDEHTDLARLWLSRQHPALACLTASLIQLQDFFEDAQNVDHALRSLGSMAYMERFGSFRRSWEDELAAAIEPQLPKNKDSHLKAVAIAGVTLDIRAHALDIWRQSEGQIALTHCFSQALECIRDVSEKELPKRIDPALDWRLTADNEEKI